MERIELDEGSVLVDQGDDSDNVYLVETGRVAVELEAGDDMWQRVRSVGPGNLLGEIAFYLGAGRTARLVAEAPTTLLCLSPETVSRLEATAPDAAILFHRAVAQTMAIRLTSTNEFVRALLR
jgi:SulP family sulfate permease